VINPVPPVGALLSQAAELAFGAQRLALAAVLRIEDAEAELGDLGFLVAADLRSVDLPAMLEDLSIFSQNLLHLADAYGHYEVRNRHAYGIRWWATS
jgi:hypothetical protein